MLESVPLLSMAPWSSLHVLISWLAEATNAPGITSHTCGVGLSMHLAFGNLYIHHNKHYNWHPASLP
jgi:hypothetical protein